LPTAINANTGAQRASDGAGGIVAIVLGGVVVLALVAFFMYRRWAMSNAIFGNASLGITKITKTIGEETKAASALTHTTVELEVEQDDLLEESKPAPPPSYSATGLEKISSTEE
jgi:hypothetical protein